MSLLGTSGDAGAQVIQRPADERLKLPGFEEPDEAEPVLPPVVEPPLPEGELSSLLGVYVQGYRILGSTVFSDEELERAVSPWAAREIRSEDLVSVRNALTDLYVRHGYVSSGATLPDQDLEDGIVELQIVEGTLGEIRIGGNDQFRDGYLRDRIEPGVGTPLHVGNLERQIQILQQDPRILRVAARLEPGDRLGEAVLVVGVEEASRFRADLRFSNYEPPSVGEFAGQIDAVVANPVGWGDNLLGVFTVSGGLRRYQGRYEIPFTRWGTLLSLDARYADAKVIESPFDDLDIESSFQSYQIGLWQPVYSSPRTRLGFGVTGDWRRSRTELLGSSFSFPGSGAQNGKATASVLRFQGEWLRRDQQQVLAARLQISWGIDVLGATTSSGNEPDGRFVAGLLQLQAARRFGASGVEAVFRTDLQLANDPLLTLEQIAVGGYATVRGYRQNQRVQDQAVISSLELRVPVWRQPEGLGIIQLAPFFDLGHVWDHDGRPGSRTETLPSAGIGLRWTLSRLLSAQIYWGHQFTSVSTSGSLQDHGVQFMLNCSLPP